MSRLWKKANFPSIEELAREVAVKKRLTIELSRSIQSLQGENVGAEEPIRGGEAINNVCATLEAIFIHGLKAKFSVTAVFTNSGNKMPEIDFWPVAVVHSHKDVLAQITSVKDITTDIGKCRSWLRLALNEGLICSYIDTMIADQSSLKHHYDTVAYLRDREEPSIMKQLLEGLEVFRFQLPFRVSTLNVWDDTPLTLAGIWTPPVSPQPVMPAVDVIEFFSEQENKSHGRSCHREIVFDKIQNDSALSECSGVNTKVEHEGHKVDASTELESKKSDVTKPKKDEGDGVSPDAEKNVCTDYGGQEVENMSKISSTDSIPDCIPDSMMSIAQMGGNRLLMQSGWSSEFEYEDEILEQTPKKDTSDTQSYDSLLESYNKNMANGVFGTPDTSDMVQPSSRMQEEFRKERADSETTSVESKSPDPEYEIIPRAGIFLLENMDKRTEQALSVIGKICPEQGLDAQNYQCRGCDCYIGMIYGKALPCSYDGLSYCTDCHANEEHYIPARIIHNWDFKKYPVSKHTKIFLTGIEQHPLLNLKVLNPLIYTVVEEMAQLQGLRIQLTFLRSYIFTCKESIAEELRKKVWPREYLYEHVHLYSIADMLQATAGSLQCTLQKVITFAKKHVLGCQLCSQKGFICEICSNTKVIYPFDLDTTYHCDFCRAVYHSACMEAKKYCPKCERKRRRQEMTDSSWYVE